MRESFTQFWATTGQGRPRFCAIAGLTPATRGSIQIWEESARDLCQIGYMAHPSLLYDEMSGMENLHYFARLYGIRDVPLRGVIRSVNLDPC